MIKNVVIHLVNEQPLLADIEALPKASDVVLVCSNLRMMNGSRPVFVDRIESTFVFPYAQVRFIETPKIVKAGKQPSAAADQPSVAQGPEAEPPTPEPPPEAEGDLEIDEDFLRRVREI